MSSMGKPASEQYTEGDYKAKHPDWHLNDAPNKAADLDKALRAMLADSKQDKWSIADIGAGAGGVLDETLKRMRSLAPGVEVNGCGFEISADAVAMAARQFPQLPMHQKFFDKSDGPFDAVMFIDVLEHLENPWEILRTARESARYLIIRQPLLENFSTFRHGNYRHQREQWGHISFFTHRFFLDLTEATGWTPLHVDLLAPWELAGDTAGGGVVQKLMIRANRVMSSFVLSGFYLNGVFGAR